MTAILKIVVNSKASMVLHHAKKLTLHAKENRIMGKKYLANYNHNYFTFLVSWKGCGGYFYKVHENREYLNILIADSNVNSAELLKSFDADLKRVDKNYDISDSIDGVKLSNDYERVIHSKFSPEEYYYI
jgi:hypothetical protein